MKLLLKVKNGTPPQRKSALRQLSDKARDFGAGPLFNQILPLLMSPTLEDQERHLLVKVMPLVPQPRSFCLGACVFSCVCAREGSFATPPNPHIETIFPTLRDHDVLGGMAVYAGEVGRFARLGWHVHVVLGLLN